MQKLKEYLKKTRKSQRELSAEIGVTPNTLSSLINGKSTPTLHVAYAIEKITEGAVTLYDWIEKEERKTE